MVILSTTFKLQLKESIKIAEENTLTLIVLMHPSSTCGLNGAEFPCKYPMGTGNDDVVIWHSGDQNKAARQKSGISSFLSVGRYGLKTGACSLPV